jgi:quercetin dioxygenase-like cupin family protein
MIIFNSNIDKTVKEKFLVSIKTFDTKENINISNSTASFVSTIDGKVENKNTSITGTVGACINSDFSVTGKGFVVNCPGIMFNNDTYVSIDSEEPGELSYIDGCSNSIIVGPPKSGDPCLNYLYFPPGIKQTFHTHPSFRIGLVVSGSGLAHINDKELELQKGSVFFLPRYVNHRFSTIDNHMSILVFHPDSDDGPLDENNPMKTRTYIS